MGSTPPVFEPEILPPTREGAPLHVSEGPEGFQPPVGPADPAERKPRPAWQVAPATHVLIAINCLVFLAMLVGHVSAWSPAPEDLLHWGANNAGAVLYYGEWQRIVTAMFVHVGLLHLGTNMWCLWNLGLLAEPLLGTYGVVAVYILSGAAGNLLSTFVNQWLYRPQPGFEGLFGPVGAGASGAVFGLAGVLIVLLKSPLLPIPKDDLKGLRRSVIMFAAINLAIGLGTMIPGSIVRIDNTAHIGGVLCGLLFAAPLVPRIGAARTRFLIRRRVAITMMVVLETLFGFYLAHL